jgi:hypothetical protein
LEDRDGRNKKQLLFHSCIRKSSVFNRNPGVNPGFTITALAEYAMNKTYIKRDSVNDCIK